MKIGGGGTPAPERAHYQTPAEALHACVLDAVSDVNVIVRMQLVDALERRLSWSSLPVGVRTLFEGVAEAMGLSD